jgi:hypothetical protein
VAQRKLLLSGVAYGFPCPCSCCLRLSHCLAVMTVLSPLRRPPLRRFSLFSLFVATILFVASPRAYSWWMWTPGDTVDNVGYKPEQPIPFSHKLHAGDKKIPCQYCHSGARRSTVSGIPPLNTCMGCHKVVATDKPHIKKITEMYQKNQPMEWVKVHDLPDHVRFSHKVHVTGAGLNCQQCHGPVQEMEVVEQRAPLQMGWCIGCHKEKGAKQDCLACHH